MKLRHVLATFALLSTPVHAATELLTNGSFEADDIPANTIGVLNAPVTGWDGVAFLFDGAPAAVWPLSGNSGAQYADIGNNSGSVASQTFTVAAGDFIQSISWFDNTATSTVTSFYTVELVDGANNLLETQDFSASADRSNWTSESLSLELPYGAGNYTLSFFGTTGVGTGDTLIDDVSALAAPAPVPVPASLPLLLAGLGVAGFVLRRQRRS